MQHLITVINQRYDGLNPLILGEEECSPGHSFGPAVRPYHLLHYIVSGSGIFVREGKTYHPREGDIFVIPPYVRTYYEADMKTPWHYIWIGFDATRELPNEFCSAILRCRGAGAIFRDMLRCEQMENGRSAYLSSRLWELVGAALEQGKEKIGYVSRALSIIHAEYGNHITVNQIAGRLNLDRSYFSSIFGREVGMSPGQYLKKVRMENAAMLIEKHGERPSTAAVSVGYSDYCDFSKIFRKYFGVSPREYARRASNGTNDRPA